MNTSMANNNRPEIIAGGGSVGTGSFETVESAKRFLETFRAYGHTRIDTARIYPPTKPGRGEELLVETGATKWATIDTKASAFGPMTHSKQSIADGIDASSKALSGAPIDVFYLHGPDMNVSLKEAMEGVNDQFQLGKFKRLGISNYSPEQVEHMVAMAEKNSA
jgi:aflatoxin B1 aldehyde reductase